MTADVVGVVSSYRARLASGDAHRAVVVGHSMGGALAVHIAKTGAIPALAGLVVIDVVEGTALEALSSMNALLAGRPKAFRSLAHAIEWSVRSGQTRNIESARVSMPGQLRPMSLDEAHSSGARPNPPADADRSGSIAEHDDAAAPVVAAAAAATAATEPRPASQLEGTGFTWRTNLLDTQPYWKGAPFADGAPAARLGRLGRV